MKKFIVAVLVVATCLTVLLACFACEKKDDATEILPKQEIDITDAEALYNIRNYLGERHKNKIFILQQDIDLSSYEKWEPIGTNVDEAFCGTLDGNNHKITGLTLKGWDISGNPEYIGQDAGIESVTSFSSVGLFGYTDSATVKNLKLDVDIYYYMDNGTGYVGAVAGFNVGQSTFEKIEVSGNIKISNLYKEQFTYDNEGKPAGLNYLSTTESYIGGVVGYSAGESVLNEINSSVNINNANYAAYYAVPNELNYIEEEGYVVVDSPANGMVVYKPETTFAGGIISYVKRSSIKNCAYDGNLNVSAHNVYSGGITGYAYRSKIEGCEVFDNKNNTNASVKILSAGIAAFADLTDIKDSEARNISLSMMRAGDLSSISSGGIFGYVSNLSTVKNCGVTDLELTAGIMTNAVGGIGGAIRDSSVTDCTAVNTEFKTTGVSGVRQEQFATFAAAVSGIYGNSVLKDCTCSAINYLDDRNVEPFVNTVAYYRAMESAYVDDEGRDAIRLYKDGSTREYLTIHADVEGNVLTVSVMNEEFNYLNEGKEAKFTLTNTVEGSLCAAEKYLDVYFEKGVGFRTPTEGEMPTEGRDLKTYVLREGRPIIENIILSNSEA